MADPCIKDSDCIHLEVDAGDGKLFAESIISIDPTNCLECVEGEGLYVPCGTVSTDPCNGIVVGSDGGVWMGEHDQGVACVGPTNPLYDSLFAGPIGPGPTGSIIVRSGFFAYANPSDCAAAVVVRAENFGPVQFSGVTVGGRVISSIEVRTLPNAFAGGPYVVYLNNGIGLGEIAFPGFNGVVMSCPTFLAPGAVETIEWRQTIEVTAGTVGTAIFRPIFFYVHMVALA